MKHNINRNTQFDINKRKRSLTRLMAAQIFYQFEFYDKKISLDEIKNNTIENYPLREDDNTKSDHKKIDLTLLENLINGIFLDFKNIDQEILPLLHNGKNISNLMMQILRLATLELRSFSDIPFKVIINEYVEISSHFFEDFRTSFVNSILENIAKKFRSEEFFKK